MRDKYDVLRRIKAAGCPIERGIPAVKSEPEMNIIQTGLAYLHTLGDRGIGIALCLRLAREKPGRITIVEFGDVYLPWGPVSVMWLDRRPQACVPVYRLPNGFDFPADTVLNHCLEGKGLCLRPGRSVEGYVLGTTLDRLPEQYGHGVILDAEFSVVDELGHEFRGQVRFAVDRSTATARRRHAAQPGLGIPGEWPLERAVNPPEEPRVDTRGERNPSGESLDDAERKIL